MIELPLILLGLGLGGAFLWQGLSGSTKGKGSKVESTPEVNQETEEDMLIETIAGMFTQLSSTGRQKSMRRLAGLMVHQQQAKNWWEDPAYQSPSSTNDWWEKNRTS